MLFGKPIYSFAKETTCKSVALLYLVLEPSFVVQPLYACFAGSNANICLNIVFSVIVTPPQNQRPLHKTESPFLNSVSYLPGAANPEKLENPQPSIYLLFFIILGKSDGLNDILFPV